MPDIDFQRIVLNLIPKKGDEPVVFYASQYETTRPFIADLMWGDTEFAPGDDCWAEIDIRKNDDNLVVITDDVSIDNNEVSVILPVQAVTCIGNNLGQIKIYADDDQLIAALNFILHVQPDPLAGGVTSETEIDNLTQQIEEIATEVIGEDYYDKTEVDALLNDKADVSDLPDMSQYYTKTATDTLLSAKADAATTYTKSETDSLLSAKANTADLATVAITGDYDDLINKPVLPDMTNYYTKSQVDSIVDNMLPITTKTGYLVNFDTEAQLPLASISYVPSATTITRCGINFCAPDGFIHGLPSLTQGDPMSSIIESTRYAYKTFYISDINNVVLQATTDNSTLYNYIFVFRYANDELVGYQGNGVPFTSFNINTSGIDAIRIVIGATAGNEVPLDISGYGTVQVEVGSVSSTYSAYNGVTVPVAEADEITTLSGVNNMFADNGSISVTYRDTIQHYIDNH